MLSLSVPHLDLEKAATVAPEVVAALRVYDPDLLVVWNKRACRWGIVRFHDGKHFEVCRVAGPDGGYAPLSMAIVERIKADDLYRQARDANQLADQMERREADEEDKRDAWFHDEMEHATRENRVSLNRAGNLIRELFG